MKRIAQWLFVILCVLQVVAAASGQTTQITASHIQYFGGTAITGKFCVQPTDQSGNPITLVTPTGQQITPQIPLCFPITSGVLSNLAVVPDTSLTQPVNACYKVTINNIFGTAVATFPCVQPQGSTWSFDAYVPSSMASIPAVTLPQFQLNGVNNPVQGYLDLVCPSCTVSGGHITITASGGAGHTGTPTIASGTGSGTSPTLGLASAAADSIGYITLTTGSSPAASAALATVSFGTTWTAAPQCFAWPANASTQALVGAAGAQVLAASTTTGQFVLTQGSTPLAASTAYEWGYSCGPNGGGGGGGGGSGSGAFTLTPVGGSAGSNSNFLTWQAVYNPGSGTAIDTYQAYVQIGSGVNPFSQLVFNHTSGTPGGGGIYFPTHLHAASAQVDNLTASAPVVCTDSSSDLTTSGCSGGGSGGGALTPMAYGGHGDGFQIPNGCTTNGTTTVVCPAGPFVSGDVGKELWIQGAGAAGVAFGANITAFTSSTTVTVASTPATNVTQNPSVFGHDDVAAIQSCINDSSLQGSQCFLGSATPNLFLTAAGWLVASSGLLIPTHANIAGSSMYGASTILSEFNGDLFSLTQGTSSLYAGQPVSGVTISNLGIYHDPSQPAGRTFHINSAAGIFGFGGMYYSTFTNIDSENAALECLWLDGHTNSNDNPNQYLTFNNLVCDGPNQMHTANEIKITGIQAQIQFMNGAINGITQSNYPNPLIFIGEKTSGQGDSPGAVSFFNYTYEVGTQGLYVGNGAVNIHFDNGYIEQVESPLIVQDSVQGLTYRGNHLANSGNIGALAQFSNSTGTPTTATIQDNVVQGSSPSPAALAVCTGATNNFAIDFLNNYLTPSSTSSCATNHTGTGAALFQPTGTTSTVDPSSVVITTIKDPNVQPGKTLTLYALSGGVGSFSLGSGGTASGNAFPINLGAYPSPLVVTAGNSIVLALLDQGAFQWTVIGGTALGTITPSSVLATGIVDGQAPVTITTGSTATLGGTYSSGYTVNHEGTAATAVTYTLPTAAVGKQYCVKNGNNGSAADTGVLTLQVSAAGQSIVYNGTAGASNGNLVSGGAAGDAACVVGISTTQWEAYAQAGTWTVH